MTENKRYELKGDKIIDNKIGHTYDLDNKDSLYFFLKNINHINELYERYFKEYHTLRRVKMFANDLKKNLDELDWENLE